MQQAVSLTQLKNGVRITNADCSEELLALCAKQNQAALRELFDRFEKPVFNTLWRILGNTQDAEEALSDVFVKVWRSADKFKGDSKFTTWLYRITTNTARDYLRSRAVKSKLKTQSMERADGSTLEVPAPESNNPEAVLMASTDNHEINDALNDLSVDDRTLIVLYHLQSLDYDEVSRITGIAPKNLKVRLFRARQRLKGILEKRTEKS